jgi:hypothetical protein
MTQPHEGKQKNPAVPVFSSTFKAALIRFAAELQRSANFQHHLSKGEERETAMKEFFDSHLPKAFGVEKGEVVDPSGQQSPQLDVIIFNKSQNVPFYTGAYNILPAEALLVSVEVKSKLTKSEIESSLKAAQLLRELRPFGKPLAARRVGGEHADDRARFFHCLFAYETDLALSDWHKAEYARLSGVAKGLGVSEALIDRVYVANRGMISPQEGAAVIEKNGDGAVLMQFYLHVLNFLQREDARRKPVPYLKYAGGLGWDMESCR